FTLVALYFTMFRLPSRQTLKALRSPLRDPLCNPPRSPLHNPLCYPLSRHVLTVPFSGLPSYDTITRRFSSYPNLPAFFAYKHQQEARDRGEIIDIHDVGGVDPT